LSLGLEHLAGSSIGNRAVLNIHWLASPVRFGDDLSICRKPWHFAGAARKGPPVEAVGA
jgi:hypothetical protein